MPGAAAASPTTTGERGSRRDLPSAAGTHRLRIVLTEQSSADPARPFLHQSLFTVTAGMEPTAMPICHCLGRLTVTSWHVVCTSHGFTHVHPNATTSRTPSVGRPAQRRMVVPGTRRGPAVVRRQFVAVTSAHHVIDPTCVTWASGRVEASDPQWPLRVPDQQRPPVPDAAQGRDGQRTSRAGYCGWDRLGRVSGSDRPVLAPDGSCG